MIIKNVSLETVCGITSQLPENPYMEFAFAGKSNVGKSSLINGLMNRKALARTSAQPGKTQTINFYNVNDQCYFVDLPGYGYTTAGVQVKEQWGKMVERYLHNAKKLKAIFLLVDIRHEPSGNDKTMYDWMLHYGFKPIIIATKLDKLKKTQVQKHIDRIKAGLQTEPGTIVIPYSSMTKQGKEEIYDLLDRYLEEGEAELTEITKPMKGKNAGSADGEAAELPDGKAGKMAAGESAAPASGKGTKRTAGKTGKASRKPAGPADGKAAKRAVGKTERKTAGKTTAPANGKGAKRTAGKGPKQAADKTGKRAAGKGVKPASGRAAGNPAKPVKGRAAKQVKGKAVKGTRTERTTGKTAGKAVRPRRTR